LDRLKDKIAVITGAASGIGLGTVELFVAEGARVLAADIQDDKGRELERRFNGQVKYHHCDVLSEDDIKSTMQAAQDAFGGLDILFNNAGTGGANDPADGVTAEGFDAVMHLHVRAALFGMKYAVPLMKAQGGGSIISTASVAGIRTGYGPVLYSIAKAAIVHMTHACAAQLGPRTSASTASAPA
jgi:NAD(P)-dependent dehydrogenase (short-subunit alcohol dehydrogenase family)